MAKTKEEQKLYMKEWRVKNKERLKAYDKEYIAKNIESHRIMKNKYYHAVEKNNISEDKRNRIRISVNKASLKRSETLSDTYVNRQLKKQGFPKEAITSDLIELKRITLKTTRLCRQLKA